MKTKFIKISTTWLLSAIFLIVPLICLPQISYGANSSTSQTQSNSSNSNWPSAPEIAAESAILIDADTGAVLYDKKSNMKAYPASTTKLMTGLLTVENTSMEETVTFSQNAIKSIVPGDSSAGTKVGEQYTVEQSLHALLLKSANEVAFGLGEHVGGDMNTFVNMMNERAKQLGALNTHFNNPSGLFDPNHYTTAHDMALIGRAAFMNQTFLSIDSYSGVYNLGPTNMNTTVRSLSSNNQMFKGRPFYYPYIKGSKTGFTDESGYTLVSYAQKDDMNLICVTMKESTSDNRYIDTKALFDYGFQNFKKVSVSDSDFSSILNTSNYYNSRVFNPNNVNFTVDAAYIDLPNNADSLSGVSISLNNEENATSDNSSSSNQNGDNSKAANVDDFSTKLNFVYGGNIVGSTNLVVKQKTEGQADTNLPYLAQDSTDTPTPQKSIVINVWYVGIGAFIFLIILFIIMNIRFFKRPKKTRKYSNRKLHF